MTGQEQLEGGGAPAGAPGRGDDDRLVVDLEGFEGPLDVLLALAREQKVDLTRLSILELADQYLSFIARARSLRLELAADYLVMAAWLAYLKSRLLLPQPADDDEPSAQEMAEALAFQLRRLEAMQQVGVRLMSRPRLGVDVFARGAPEGLRRVRRSIYEVTLYELLAAYGEQHRRRTGGTMHIGASAYYSMDDALRRLARVVGSALEWHALVSFLPPEIEGGIVARSALASTLAASLELTRAGKLELRQNTPFGPIYLRARGGGAEPTGGT